MIKVMEHNGHIATIKFSHDDYEQIIAEAIQKQTTIEAVIRQVVQKGIDDYPFAEQ